ncbi:MAG TPA: universal stress protein [Euzebyales bacterium]|nr:universal stress protein [Euzebyales bacterium]
MLVAVDGSPMARAAFDAGVAFARQAGLPVHLVTAALSDDVVEPLEDRRSELHELCALAEAPRSHAHLLLETTPADAILSVAEQLGDVLICMGTHGRGRVGWALLGSVAEDVVARSRFPVLLTGPRRRTRMEHYAQVFVALDGSICAETALPLAQRLGSALGASLTLVSAAAQDGRRGQAQRRLTAAYLREVAATLTGPAPVETVVLTGDAVEALVEALPSQGGLLVMSTHGRSGLQRVTLGSVASSVCRRAELPVIVARPAALRREHAASGC